MTRQITGFHQDDEAHWVADLSCGHTQHLRHDPPTVERPWVLTAAGRERRLGETLECPECARAELPSGAKVFHQTEVFAEQSVPPPLLKRHKTRPGVWGRIAVLSGSVVVRVESQAEKTIVVGADEHAIMPPEWPHTVELRDGARFRLDLLRVEPRRGP